MPNGCPNGHPSGWDSHLSGWDSHLGRSRGPLEPGLGQPLAQPVTNGSPSCSASGQWLTTLLSHDHWPAKRRGLEPWLGASHGHWLSQWPSERLGQPSEPLRELSKPHFRPSLRSGGTGALPKESPVRTGLDP